MAIEAEQRYYMKLKAAYYYYEQDMTQAEIADLLKVSRITLGKLLREAKEEGMVKIEIVDDRNIRHCLEAEEALKDRYGLQDVRVADTVMGQTGQDALNRHIALLAARYVEQHLKSGMRIGIAWGRTLQLMTQALHKDKSITGIEIVTLLGLAGTASSIIQPNILAQMFLEKYGGKGYVINAPYICQTEELANRMKSEPSVITALEKSKNTDMTLIGVGEKPEISKQYNVYYNFDDESLRILTQAGAVGDVCANFFNINGELIKSPVCRRVVSIDPESLKNHKKTIMMGGGPKKYESLLGALRGGFAGVLITDYLSASAVLNAGK